MCVLWHNDKSFWIKKKKKFFNYCKFFQGIFQFNFISLYLQWFYKMLSKFNSRFICLSLSANFMIFTKANNFLRFQPEFIAFTSFSIIPLLYFIFFFFFSPPYIDNHFIAFVYEHFLNSFDWLVFILL